MYVRAGRPPILLGSDGGERRCFSKTQGPHLYGTAGPLFEWLCVPLIAEGQHKTTPITQSPRGRSSPRMGKATYLSSRPSPPSHPRPAMPLTSARSPPASSSSSRRNSVYSSTLEALSGFAIEWSSSCSNKPERSPPSRLRLACVSGVAKPKPGIAPQVDVLTSTRSSLGAALTATWSLIFFKGVRLASAPRPGGCSMRRVLS